MEQIEAINKRLEELVSSEGLLYEASRYSLFGSGKRIRPLLTLATVEMLGGSCEKALTPACALELVHTYSLIHDDLPCMDDDDFRRGKPSLHKAYGEGNAVLAGDYLLTYAFEILSESSQLTEYQRLGLISTLAKAAGGAGMIGGQVLDLGGAEGVSLEMLHSLKTGALFKAAMVFGGIIAGKRQEFERPLEELGAQIGLLFQIVDDIHDGDHGFTENDAKAQYSRCQALIDHFPAPRKSLESLICGILESVQKNSSNASILANEKSF